MYRYTSTYDLRDLRLFDFTTTIHDQLFACSEGGARVSYGRHTRGMYCFTMHAASVRDGVSKEISVDLEEK